MYLSDPLSSDFSDEPPPYIFGGGAMTCKEQPAIRRILGSHGKPGGDLRRHRRRTTPHQRHGRHPRRWEDDGGRALAADSHVLLPSDRRRDSPMATSAEHTTTHYSSRRMPQLVRQEAFCAASTSRDWRSLDYVDDDDELYRLGLLYDESRDHRERLSRSIVLATHAGDDDDDDVIHSARFSLDTIAHEEPAYTVRIMPSSAQRRRRPGYRYDQHPTAARTDCDGEDETMSDDSDEDHPYHHRKSVRFHNAPALTLDLSFTPLADHVQQAWPHYHGRQDRAEDGSYHHYHNSHAQRLLGDATHHVTPSPQSMQHIIYELHEINDTYDNDQYRQTDITRTTCPGTPITQTPELVSDDEDITSDDAEWFSFMEDGWTPVEEEVISLDGTDNEKLGASAGPAITETWVVLGHGQDFPK